MASANSLEGSYVHARGPGPEGGAMTEVAGIDAYRRGKESGWVAVLLRDGDFAEATAGRTFEAVLSPLPGAHTIGIDMPIGLPTNGPRPCDVEARAFVGVRRNSVFIAPPLEALKAETHAEATRLCKELTGVGLSQQAYGLRKKLLEVASIARADERIREVHPEVSFREMAGTELSHPKTTWSGQAARRSLLAGQGIAVPDDLGKAGSVPPDDLLDAAAAAWSATRIASGRAKSFPADAVPGSPMTIWR
jgi:predicted RNase H-like nuclease